MLQATMSVSMRVGRCGHTTRASYEEYGRWPDNVDRNRMHLNTVLAGEGLTSTREAFNEFFEPLVKKRYDQEMAKPPKSRHVKRLDEKHAYDPWKYFTESKVYGLSKTEKEPVVGLVYQVGDREGISGAWDYNDPEMVADMTRFYTEVFNDFRERNPDFHVLSAAVHFDEETPHLHIDGIPLAKDKNSVYGIAAAFTPMVEKRMSKKERSSVNSRAKAGLGGTIAWWQEREMEALENLGKQCGIERIPGNCSGRKSLNIHEYKAARELIDRERAAVDQEISDHRQGLIDQIVQDAREQAEEEADRIREDARLEAGQIIQAAKEEADNLTEKLVWRLNDVDCYEAIAQEDCKKISDLYQAELRRLGDPDQRRREQERQAKVMKQVRETRQDMAKFKATLPVPPPPDGYVKGQRIIPGLTPPDGYRPPSTARPQGHDYSL